MKFYDLKSFYIVTDIKEHQENKQRFLDLIDIMPLSNMITDVENISKTDWNLPKEQERKYLEEFYNMITPYMNVMTEKLKCKNWKIQSGWFQQYGKNDVHNWHVHEGVNYANVYFLNLPDESVKTQLFDVKEGKIMNEIDVREGQLLTFPAHILHRSPPNMSNNKKTIISFNTDFHNEY